MLKMERLEPGSFGVVLQSVSSFQPSRTGMGTGVVEFCFSTERPKRNVPVRSHHGSGGGSIMNINRDSAYASSLERKGLICSRIASR